MAKVSWESEKELEDWIYNESEATSINPINNEEIHSIYRQVDLGSYGVADLVTFLHMPNGMEITIIEVKKENIDVKTFAQLSRYRKGVERYFEGSHDSYCIEIRLIAVAPEIVKNDDSVWLSDLLTSSTDFYAFTCNVDLKDGVVFNQTTGWVKSNEDFNKFHQSIGLAEIARFDRFSQSIDLANERIKDIANHVSDDEK